MQSMRSERQAIGTEKPEIEIQIDFKPFASKDEWATESILCRNICALLRTVLLRELLFTPKKWLLSECI